MLKEVEDIGKSDKLGENRTGILLEKKYDYLKIMEQEH